MRSIQTVFTHELNIIILIPVIVYVVFENEDCITVSVNADTYDKRFFCFALHGICLVSTGFCNLQYILGHNRQTFGGR